MMNLDFYLIENKAYTLSSPKRPKDFAIAFSRFRSAFALPLGFKEILLFIKIIITTILCQKIVYLPVFEVLLVLN